MTMNLPYIPMRLDRVHHENESVSTLAFEESMPDAQPGQFAMVWLPDFGEKPFCVACADPVKITVAGVGPFTRALCSLKPGARAWLRGPFGRGFKLSGQHHLLVGGGYGAAPLLFLTCLAVEVGQTPVVCLGARSREQIILKDDFEQLGCRVLIATEDGSQGFTGLVTSAMNEGLSHYPVEHVYACGPTPMLSAVARICSESDLPAQLSYEALMRCGIGLCGSCELGEEARLAAGIPSGWLTCKDGPVFFLHSA